MRAMVGRDEAAVLIGRTALTTRPMVIRRRWRNAQSLAPCPCGPRPSQRTSALRDVGPKEEYSATTDRYETLSLLAAVDAVLPKFSFTIAAIARNFGRCRTDECSLFKKPFTAYLALSMRRHPGLSMPKIGELVPLSKMLSER